MKPAIFRFPGIKIFSLSVIMSGLLIIMELLCAYPWLIWLGNYIQLGETKLHLSLACYLILMFYTAIISSAYSKKALNKPWAPIFPSIILLWAVLLRWDLGAGYVLCDPGWFVYINDHLFSFIIAALSGLYFIWRAIDIHKEVTYQKFIKGLVSIILILVIWHITIPQAGGWSLLDTYAFVYFAAGLLAIALTNFENLGRFIARYRESTESMLRRLFPIQVIIIVIILVSALIISTVLTGSLPRTIYIIAGFLWKCLETGLYYIFFLVGFVVEFLVWIRLLLIGDKGIINLPDLPEFLKKRKDLKEVARFHIPPILLLIIKWMLIAGFFVFIIYLIRRLLMRYLQTKTEDGVEEELESLWSLEYFKADLRDLLAFLFPWFFRKKKEASVTTAQETVTSLADQLGRDMNAREIYRALLQYGRRIGLPRKSHETAYEYSERLGYACEIRGKALNSITNAYVLERYNEEKTKPKVIKLLNRLWLALKTRLLKTNTDLETDSKD